jgi:hypothetical protein
MENMENIWRKVVRINNLNNDFFKFVPKHVVRFSRRHCQNSKVEMLGLNELKLSVPKFPRRTKWDVL